MADGIHSCSYYCMRPSCISRQRDELRDKLFAQPSALSLDEARKRAEKFFPEERRAQIAHAAAGYEGPEYSGKYSQPGCFDCERAACDVCLPKGYPPVICSATEAAIAAAPQPSAEPGANPEYVEWLLSLCEQYQRRAHAAERAFLEQDRRNLSDLP